MGSKLYIDKNGYYRRKADDRLLHRNVAYFQIYLKNRDKYPLPFKKYIVHHKDGNKRNSYPNNLEIMLPGEHKTHHRNYLIEKHFLKPLMSLIMLIFFIFLIFLILK